MQSQELRGKFDGYIAESEYDYLNDKLSCFKGRAVDLQLGAWSHNYFNVRDHDKFVEGVRQSVSYFGASEKLERLVKQCERLWGTNLYEHMVGKLCNMYYKQELKPIVDWIEKCGMLIYNEDAHEDLLDYVDCFADCCLGDIYLNDRGQMVRKSVIM